MIYDPIAAVSTPHGRGGIAVIRLSGEGVLPIADRVFRRADGGTLAAAEDRKAYYGAILSEGKPIDDGLATVFFAPRSFTGEDVVEISCHGGILLTQKILTSVLTAGCRMAEAGEYTRRAFLNGKIRLASAAARGVLHRGIRSLSDELSDLIASVYAVTDYPDEDLGNVTTEELTERTEKLARELERLCATYRIGQAVSEGILTVIAGRPNTGKSSLLNRLLGRDRAIVTDRPGTTRDTVEETVSLGGVTLRLCDTAGLRDTEDEIEAIGVKRSREKIGEAGLVLAVFDGSRPLTDGDLKLIASLREKDTPYLILLNKADLGVRAALPPDLPEPVVLSTLTGEGVETLTERIASLFIEEKIDYDTTPILAEARQYAAATRAKESLVSASKALRAGFTQDVAGLDLEAALAALDEMDGRGAAEEITDRIFSRFCVGK